MTTLEKLIAVCNAVFEGEINLDGVKAEDNLRDDVGINSVGMLYMAMALEEEFAIKFRNEDFATIFTVQDVIDCIDRKVAEK